MKRISSDLYKIPQLPNRPQELEIIRRLEYEWSESSLPHIRLDRDPMVAMKYKSVVFSGIASAAKLKSRLVLEYIRRTVESDMRAVSAFVEEDTISSSHSARLGHFHEVLSECWARLRQECPGDYEILRTENTPSLESASDRIVPFRRTSRTPSISRQPRFMAAV